jgi:hypothetical protein
VRDALTALAREVESERYAAPRDLDPAARAERLDRIARLTREVTRGLADANTQRTRAPRA